MENFARYQKKHVCVCVCVWLRGKAGQTTFFMKFILVRRSSTEGMETSIQSVPSTWGEVLVAPGMNEDKIFTREGQRVA